MKHYTKQITKLLLTGFLSLILVACDNEERLNYFNQQVNKNIQDKNSVVVNAKDLTNFEWDKVCFRGHRNDGLPYIPFISSGRSMLFLYFYIEKKEIESFELSTNFFSWSDTYYAPIDEDHNQIYEKYQPLLGLCRGYSKKLTLKKQGKKVKILIENDKNDPSYQKYFEKLRIEKEKKDE